MTWCRNDSLGCIPPDCGLYWLEILARNLTLLLEYSTTPTPKVWLVDSIPSIITGSLTGLIEGVNSYVSRK